MLALAAPARALEWTPVFNAGLSGGQYFFQKQKGSLGGNANVTAAALVKAGELWSVMPMYAGAYRGTKGVDDGVGAGTLFQQQMDHTVSVTGIRKLRDTTWRLKPSVGYKREFLKETRDEEWGKGLFDYEKIAVGFEAEDQYRDPFAWRVGLDLYRVRFPNYSSLESRSGVDPFGDPLGRELAPKKVLDTTNVQVSLSGSRPWPKAEPKFVLQGSYSFLLKNFDDQRLVDGTGQFQDSGRKDFVSSLAGSAVAPVPVRPFGVDARLDAGFGLTLAYNRSNQNTFDATFAKYVPDSYSYWQFGAGPNATLSWGDRKSPTWASASLRWSRQLYTGRLTQDVNGVYEASKQRHDRVAFSLGYGYPIAPQFTMTFKTNFLWATSNQKYEKNYRYDYRAVNYLIGVTYEY